MRRRVAAPAACSAAAGPGAASGTAIRLRRVIAPATTTSGRRPRKTTRQPSVWVMPPASAGPITPGRTQAVERVANIGGRSRSGSDRPIATYAVGGIAPAPRPWRKRPPTSTAIVGARPHTTRPRANSASPPTNGRASPARSMSPPATTMPTRSPRKNAENAQPYSSRPCSSTDTAGMTVPTARASNAMSVIVKTRPRLSARRPGDQRPSSTGAPGPTGDEGCWAIAEGYNRVRAVGRVRSRAGAPRPARARRSRRP